MQRFVMITEFILNKNINFIRLTDDLIRFTQSKIPLIKIEDSPSVLISLDLHLLPESDTKANQQLSHEEGF